MGEIVRVRHRHGDQQKGAPDLVLEVGKPVPPFYQLGRPPGVSVRSISGRDPIIATLNDGDHIYIGERSVREITREDDAGRA